MLRNLLGRVLALGALIGIGALEVCPAVATAAERPFMAMWNGNASLQDTDDPCVKRNDETGQGDATHLGRFTWASVETVDFCAIPNGVAVIGETFTMTAANGDRLFGKYKTVGKLNDAKDTLIIRGTFEITGGTGRFAGATGGGDLYATAYLAPGLPFIGAYYGTIDY